MSMKKVFIILLLLAFAGHWNSVSAQQPAPDQSAILAAYNAAIYDASVYRFSNLRPLKPLKFDPATKTVSVVSLTDWKYHVGPTKLPLYLWVTPVPEAQNICRGFSGDNLDLRLRQLFGLHPNSKIVDFVVITVKEGDIFRPTANPDPTTTLPCSYPVPVNCGEAFPENVSDKHLRWFANQMLNSYVISEAYLIPYGYPWTRLGYTYDWKPGANKYGVSEYVIQPGSTVTVIDVVPYKKYCTPAE
jgi:hypothetical protein